MFAKTLNCGNCGNLVDFAFHNIIDYRHLAPEELHRIRVPSSTPGRNGTAPLMRGEKGSDRATGASFVQCPRCNFPSMILFETTGLALSSLHIVGQQSKDLGLNIPVFDVLKQYPPVPEPDLDPLWPVSIRRPFSDTQKMHRQGISPSIVLTTCGTVLELALKDLDPEDKGSTLYKRIENLHAAGVITSPIRDWAHDIRLDRNDAVHEGEGDERDAAEYIEFLKMFFNMVFSLPKRIAEKRATASQDR